MLREGSLFFPVTPSGNRGEIVPGVLTEHVDSHLQFPVAGVFTACGTGEFGALSASQISSVLQTVRERIGSTPLFGPAGGPLGHAVECALRARDCGADGLLVMSPYPAAPTEDGHRRYLEQVMAATELPVLVYHRPEAPITPATLRALLDAVPHLLGVKDGVGDLAAISELKRTGTERRRDFLTINGLSLAEGHELSYRPLGIHRYTSALFTMDPVLGNAYLQGRRRGDTALCEKLLAVVIRPLESLRDTTPGYEVSLVKAAVRSSGQAVGGVRAPWIDLNGAEEARLGQILRAGHRILAGD